MLNYFELLGLPVRYKIDEKELVRSYLEKQRTAHPDNDGDAAHSSQLNKAYAVLRNPLQRAEYMMQLQGRDGESIFGDLSVRMFAMREQFENISDPMERRDFLKTVGERLDSLFNTLKDTDDTSDDFFTIFCEAKFIHSFLDKVRCDGCNRD